MAGEIFWGEIGLVLVTGLIGGFVHDMLQGSFSMPGWDDPKKQDLWKPGFLGDLVVGAGAAFVTYGSTIATATSTTTLQLQVLSFTSGIGGSAVLMSYENGTNAGKYKEKLKALGKWS